MHVTAVYPGTFDPFTKGHEDLARRAANLFDRVVVGVANSQPKGTFFSFDERIDMARTVLAPHQNVEVIGFAGLLTDFLAEQKATVILRGLRAPSDFEYEFQMAGMNQILAPNVDTFFLTPGQQYMFISATLVREIAQLGGDVSGFVPEIVRQRFDEKLTRRSV